MNKTHGSFRLLLLLSIALWLLIGCADNGRANPNGQTAVLPSPRPATTLQPTFTPQATAGPLPSLTPPPPRPTAVPSTPIPFADTVFELRYQIPALSLDRRLQGNVASEIVAVDETTGLSRQRSNQAGIMLELRAALPAMKLEPLPADCPGCVSVTYDMPGLDVSGSGWLQDPVLLASIENYLTAALGPHFPPDTVVGLRRAASPYAPAHSVALTSDGRIWTWLATEAQVSSPGEAATDLLSLSLLPDLPLTDLQPTYAADCAGSPLETLLIRRSDIAWEGEIVCPEMALPDTLLPLYLELDQRLAAKTADVSLPRPALPFPLDGLVDYRRADGSQLTLLADGTLIGIDTSSNVFTGTLTSTSPLSLTATLVRSNLLQPGLRTFTAAPSAMPQTILVVRGPTGVLDGQWDTLPDREIFVTLNNLLADLIGGGPADPAAPQPEAEETAVSTTIAPSPTP
ncbi:MAG: hypothetical protein IPF56_06885 [Chloroflexi bacterium]|nr:hypothetical protein [Chloroflexota bacterium]